MALSSWQKNTWGGAGSGSGVEGEKLICTQNSSIRWLKTRQNKTEKVEGLCSHFLSVVQVCGSDGNLPAMQKTWVWSLGWEDPLGEEMATHSSILDWVFHGQRSLVGYSPWDHRVRHDWATDTHTQAAHGNGKLNLTGIPSPGRCPLWEKQSGTITGPSLITREH